MPFFKIYSNSSTQTYLGGQIWGKIPQYRTIPLCVMVSSAMELQSGVFRFCRAYTQKQTQTKCLQGLRALCSVSCVFIFTLRLQYICLSYALDESQLFWLQNRQQNFDLKEMALHKSIPLKSWGLSVYVCMSNYKFCHASRYGAETWHRGRSGPRGWCATFWSDPIKCHRSSRGQTTLGMLYGYHFKSE